MQHFKCFSSQPPNIWYLIYTNSKFFKVDESLLCINSFSLKRTQLKQTFTHLTELCLAFVRTMGVWNEEKYIFLGNNILQIIQKKIKDDLIQRQTICCVDSCSLLEHVANSEATLVKHKSRSQCISDVCHECGRCWQKHMDQTHTISDLIQCNTFLMLQSEQTDIRQEQKLFPDFFLMTFMTLR